MSNRYDRMEPTDHRWIAQGIGVYAARLAAGRDEFVHPGDDTGRAAAANYRQEGARGAARVLRAFKRGYDARRVHDGYPPVADDEFIETVGHALSIELTPAEIADVRTALERSPRPLTQADDGFN